MILKYSFLRSNYRKKLPNKLLQPVEMTKVFHSLSPTSGADIPYNPPDLHESVLNSVTFLLPRHYIIRKRLGKGAYGTVCSGTNLQTNEQVAIKKCSNVFPAGIPQTSRRALNMRRSAVITQEELDKQNEEEDLLVPLRLLRELKILNHLDQHPNIVHLKGTSTQRTNL